MIQELVTKAGLTEDQAGKAILVMKDFIASKLPPGFDAMVNNFFGQQAEAKKEQAADELGQAKDQAQTKAESLTDNVKNTWEKVEDKAEDLAKSATDKMDDLLDKAEDAGEEMLDKIKGFFGGKDKKD